MRPISTKSWAAITVAVVVIGVGGWYSRSVAPKYVNENIAPIKISEQACPPQTLREQVAAADLILTGEVFVVLPDKPDALVYIKPLTIYKGKAPIPLIIRAEAAGTRRGNTGGSQQVVVLPDGTKEKELHFASDQPPYLLFLRAADNKFLTSRCDGSRLLGDGLTKEEQNAITAARLTTP